MRVKYLLLIAVLMLAIVAALVFVSPPENGARPELVLPWQVDSGDRFWRRDADGGLPAQDEQATLYRWREPDGSWAFGDVPPAGVEAEAIRQAPVQRMPAVPAPASDQ